MDFSVHHVSRNAPHGTAFFEHPESWENRKEHYEKVVEGEVDPSRLEIELMEAIFHDEQNGIGDHPAPPYKITDETTPRRSLSVGDVVVLGGTPYEVGSVGFRDITERNEEPSTGDRTPLEIPEEDPEYME